METDDGRARQTRSEGKGGRAAERCGSARGPVRRSRVIQGFRHPPRWLGQHLEVRGGYGRWRCEFTCGDLESGLVQPDHASVVVCNLRAVVVVIVFLEVAVDDGMRMVGICLVDVLGRSNGREREARPNQESNGRTPRRKHDFFDYRSSHEGASNTPARREPAGARLTGAHP